MLHSHSVSTTAVFTLFVSLALCSTMCAASLTHTINCFAINGHVLQAVAIGSAVAIVLSSILSGTWGEVGAVEQLAAGTWHESDAKKMHRLGECFALQHREARFGRYCSENLQN